MHKLFLFVCRWYENLRETKGREETERKEEGGLRRANGVVNTVQVHAHCERQRLCEPSLGTMDRHRWKPL